MKTDFSLNENIEKLGKRFPSTNGAWTHSNKNEAMIVYVSGLPEFDTAPGIHKFEETDCILQIHPYENGILFFLCFNNLVPFKGVGIWKENLISLELIENAMVIVPKFNMWKDSLPLGLGGGAIGATMAFFRKQKEAERRKFSIIGSREKKGNIAKLHFRNEEDGMEKK